jgi:hypothetical protein
VKTGGISGLAVAMVAAGGLLMYSAIKNYTILDTLRWAMRGGKGPTPTPRASTASVPAGGPSTGLTGTAKSPNPDAGIGKSSTTMSKNFQLPTTGFNKPLP